MLHLIYIVFALRASHYCNDSQYTHQPGSSGSSMQSMDGLYPFVMVFIISSLDTYEPPFLMRIAVFK